MRDNPFLDATVGGMLATVAARFPDREAIVATDTRITYAGLHAGACRVARALLALGIGKDDKVALWLPNRPAWLFAQYGCALIGAVAVALNPRYKAHELRYILAQSDSTRAAPDRSPGPGGLPRHAPRGPALAARRRARARSRSRVSRSSGA